MQCDIINLHLYVLFLFQEDIKSLCSHVVENFSKELEAIDYVQTFKALKLRYEQHQDKLKDRDRATIDRYAYIEIYFFLFSYKNYKNKINEINKNIIIKHKIYI